MTRLIGQVEQPGPQTCEIIDGMSVVVETGPDLPITVDAGGSTVNISQEHGEKVHVIAVRSVNIDKLVQLLKSAHHDIGVRD